MTGYAAVQSTSTSTSAVAGDAPSQPTNARLGLEIRSVNSRFLDLTFRLPDELRQLEPALRELLTAKLKRGKIELRVALDPALECPPSLAPLIDPNHHSCGTVRPHGAAELAHPEPGFYIAGMKSYGRAPTFLLATGHEQARSIVADIAGDHEAAARMELVLPETGVCNGPGPRAGVGHSEKRFDTIPTSAKAVNFAETAVCGCETVAEPAKVAACC